MSIYRASNFFRLALLCSVSALTVPAEAGKIKADKEWTVACDFWCNATLTENWDVNDCEREIKRLMEMCAHYGFDRFLFQSGGGAIEIYHSNVMTTGSEKIWESAGFKRAAPEGLNMGMAPMRVFQAGTVMDRCEPLALSVKYARQNGLKIWAWITIFDSAAVSCPGEFFREHPQYWWLGKDGKSQVVGAPCYAYPEVRQYRLAQMKEISEKYDIDGLVLCIRSHGSWYDKVEQGSNKGSREYGFNEPVVKEYIRRFGIDPRLAKPDSLEELRFVQLKADYLTAFVRDVRAITNKRGQKLAINASVSNADAVHTTRMYVDTDRIIREGLIDELFVIGHPATDLRHWKTISNGKVKVSTWDRGCGLRSMLDNPSSDGCTYYELMTIDYPDRWEEHTFDVVNRWKAEKEAKR